MSKEFVKITEVGPRDGLQNEKQTIATSDKFKMVQGLIDAGLRNIEVSSFVSPKWVPQLADAEELFARLVQYNDQVRLIALVPNPKGFSRALDLNLKNLAFFTAASETFNQKNINRSLEQSFDEISEMISLAKQKNLWVRVYLSTIFDCPYEGKMDLSKVVDWIQRIFTLPIDEISLGDTIGKGTPDRVLELSQAISNLPKEKIAFHFHDTYGRALANAIKALESGYRHFDTSIGALGGCPYALGASGNLASEDLISALHDMGFETGVDLSKLCENFQALECFSGRLSHSRFGAAFLAQK